MTYGIQFMNTIVRTFTLVVWAVLIYAVVFLNPGLLPDLLGMAILGIMAWGFLFLITGCFK
jgi:hypothetical protein